MAEEPHRKKIHVYAQDQDGNRTYVHGNGIRIELRWSGTGVEQLLAGTDGSGIGKLVPCNTLLSNMEL